MTVEFVNGQPAAQVLTLDQCTEMALQKNHRRPASQFEVAVAEAQHRQALAGYWPQVNVTAGYQRLDQPLNFLFPGGSLQVPAQAVTIPASTATVTLPAGAFGPGFPPTSLQIPVSYPDQTINTPAQKFTFPDQNVKVIDRDLIAGSLSMKWLLLDGGMRSGYRQQSGGYLEMMRHEARRTDLELADDVKRYYWGAVLAGQLRQLGADTLARMEVTFRMTETLYKEGAGRVTKTDYLDNSVMVETVRAMVAQLEKNEIMAQAALAYTSGLPANATIKPASSEIPFPPFAHGYDELLASAYEFNPDWGKLEAAIKAAEGMITTARSGYYPKVALTGELRRWWNGGYDSGVATPQNRAGWAVGLGMEFPLFDGLLTRNRVSEAIARLNSLKEKRFVLREGLGLQVRDVITGLDAAAKSLKATEQAMRSSQENRDLNERAYQAELVDTEKVIRSQLMEALMSAQHYKIRYDYLILQSQLSLVVGREVRDAVQGTAR